MTSSVSHDSRRRERIDTRRRERIDTGLYRRVTAEGVTRYDVAIWQHGRQQVRALPAGTSEAQARKQALKARVAANDRQAPIAAAVRFDNVVRDYLDHAEARTRITGKGRMSPTTVQTYRTRLRDYVTPVIGRRKLSELGKADMLRVVDRCHTAGLSDWATHGVLTALRAVLRFARERDMMTADPFQGVPRDRLPAQRSRAETAALRPEDAALVIDQLSTSRDKVLGCLLLDAGLRVSEAVGLTWGDVSLTERVLHVRGQLAPLKRGEAPTIVPPKSVRGVRVVPLLPRLQAALEALYVGEDDGAFVLRTRRGTPLSRHNAARTIREAGERAKLGNVTPHMLRRTLGTALSRAGVDVAAAAAIMGHSTEVNHGSYVRAHRDEQEREQARAALVDLGLGVTPT
jgi:integrase